MGGLIEIYARIPPRRIAPVKFIIEGYDNLAGMTTVDRQSGLVRLYCHPSERALLVEIIEQVCGDSAK